MADKQKANPFTEDQERTSLEQLLGALQAGPREQTGLDEEEFSAKMSQAGSPAEAQKLQQALSQKKSSQDRFKAGVEQMKQAGEEREQAAFRESLAKPLAMLSDAWTGTNFSSMVARTGNPTTDNLKNQLLAMKIKNASKPKSGKFMSPVDIGKISDSFSGPGLLDNLSATLDQNAQHQGPIHGLQVKMNPWSKGKTLTAVIDTTRQKIGKLLEGGVLRKEDEIKYRRILPVQTDTMRTAKAKIEFLRRTMLNDMARGVDFLEQNGYFVTPYRQRLSELGYDPSQRGAPPQNKQAELDAIDRELAEINASLGK